MQNAILHLSSSIKGWGIVACVSVFGVVLKLASMDLILTQQFLRGFIARSIAASAAIFCLALPIRRRIARTFPTFAHVFLQRTRVQVFLLVVSMGILGNALGTMVIAKAFDQPLIAEMNRAASNEDWPGYEYPGSPLAYIRITKTGLIEHWIPLAGVTDREFRLLMAVEDERLGWRWTGVDGRGYLRIPLNFVLKGRVEGGSNLGDQYAEHALGLNPSGLSVDSLVVKILKALAGIRVSDLTEPRELTWLYLNRVADFGTIHGHRVVGLELAALVFYGVPHTALGPGQLLELFLRLRAPANLPYQQDNETTVGWEARRERLWSRYASVLERAEELGLISVEERRQALREFLKGLRTRDEVFHALIRYRVSEVAAAVQDATSPEPAAPLVVQVSLDHNVQLLLEEAKADAAPEIVAAIPPHRINGRKIAIDGIVLDGGGAIVAETGAVRSRSDVASLIKAEIYVLALQKGVLPSMRTFIGGACQQTATSGLINSVNECATELVRRMGRQTVAAELRAMGYHVVDESEQIAIGSGVAASPLQIARRFSRFNPASLGHVVKGGLIRKISNKKTGAIIYDSQSPSIPDKNLLEVQRVLSRVPLEGTARVLSADARKSEIIGKTGTRFFYRNGRVLGRGGSWFVGIDTLTGFTIAVRARWESNEAFPLEGGRSAAVVARNLIRATRAYHVGQNKSISKEVQHVPSALTD